MEEKTTCWVLAYNVYASTHNTGHVTKFDNFKDADAYAVQMNSQSDLLYSVTFCIGILNDYCKAYKLNIIDYK